MRQIRRFFFDVDNAHKGSKITLNKELNNRIFNVLRLKDGNDLEIITKKHILSTKISNNSLFVSGVKNLIIPSHQRILAVSLIEKTRFDMIVEKATELNITKIIPIITARTKPFGNKNYKKYMERWDKISKQALSQCYRDSILEISEPIKIKEILEETFFSSFNKFILSTVNPQTNIKKLQKQKDTLFLLGPEGGFTNEEENLAIENNFFPISLSGNILRTETACIAIASIIEYLNISK